MWFLFQIAIMTWLERRVSLGAQGRLVCRGVSRRFRGQLVISQIRPIAATAIKLTSANQKNAWVNSQGQLSMRLSELPPLLPPSTETEGARPECRGPPENPWHAKASP